MEKKLRVGMFGHKWVPSREGGIEIVVEELAKRMVKEGHQITCYNRAGHHVSGAEYDVEIKSEYEGIRLKTVPTIERKGLAAVSSSFFAALFCWIPKLFGKRVIVTIHGGAVIIGTTI